QTDLEIAWHFILGRDLSRAIPYALTGAEYSLQAGAAREAELILRHLMREEVDQENARQIRLLLSSALMGQSKAEEALPHLEHLLSVDVSDRRQAALAAHLYASAMYLLNMNSMAKHSEMAERALTIARECDDDELLARALFECGRAAIASGNLEMTRKTRDEIRKVLVRREGESPAMALHADAYCSYFLADLKEAATSAQRAVAGLGKGGDLGELAQAYTGLGNCMHALGRLKEARDCYALALQLSRKLGDDCRISIVTSNIAACYLVEGNIELAKAFGEESLDVGRKAPTQPGLLRTWTNLAFAYLISGDMDKAMECFGSWRRWIRNGRSWAANMEYWCDSAGMELALGNASEALELIATAERACDGKDGLVVNQGTFECMRVFSAYHTVGSRAAADLGKSFLKRFEACGHVIAQAELLAVGAWLEMQTGGAVSDATQARLGIFDDYRLPGKRAILTIQGFLDKNAARILP
ncbi:MAG TPA: tetratricopeptide repeat protein, partial [Nitrospirota bacterium]